MMSLRHRSHVALAACLFLLAIGASPAEAAANLIVNGNFSGGNSGFSSGYTYVNSCGEYGAYMIAKSPFAVCAGWADIGDHTTGAGKMMIVDGSTAPNTDFWSEDIAVSPGTEYVLKFWGTSVDPENFAKPSPRIQVYINGQPVGRPLTLPPHYDGQWHEATVRWSSGGNTSATISLVDLKQNWNGNDFVIDDISLRVF